MTSLLQSGRRVGAQRPRVELTPPAKIATAGFDAIELASIAGLDLDEWQQNVLIGSLGEVREGRWASFEVAVVVPRQNGKGSILEARELAGLFLFDEKLIIHSAHEFKTAAEAFNRILGLIQNTPDLDAQVAKVTTAHGSEGIELKNGNRLKFMARSANSGRGFSADLIILDEAYALKSSEMAAMLPTMAAKSMDGNPQIWYTSSAGMPQSEVLASVRERGMNPASKRLAYFEWSVEENTPKTSVAGWYQANPGLGIRMSKDHVQSELEALDDDEFKRERLGIWERIGGESVIPEWASALDPLSERGEVVSFAIDVPPSRDSAVITAASFRADGKKHIVAIDQRAGTSWVSSELKRLKEKFQPVAIVAVAGSAAASLEAECKRDGVRLMLINMRQYAEACGLFMDDLRADAIRHRGQEHLDEAVDAARMRPYGETLFTWNRKDPTADISPLIAGTLANFGLQTKGLRKISGTKSRGKVLIL